MIVDRMFSLFAETKFWSYTNSLQIADTDFGAFRFVEKKDISKSNAYAISKQLYAENRSHPVLLRNRRPERLRSRLKELEQILECHKIVSAYPRPDGCLRLVAANGLVINVKTNVQNSALASLKFDRFLVGKVAEICDVVHTKSHLIFTHADHQLTLVHLMKPVTSASSFEKLQKFDPKIQVVDLVGGAGRRLQRHVSANTAGDMVLTWWQTSSHEVYPWAPSVKDWDRANVHVYSLAGTYLELLAYFRTESEPVSVRFSNMRNNAIWVLEQKVSRKGEVTAECSCYNIVKRQLVKKTVTSIPLQTHVSCHAFSPDENRLAVGCIDGSIVVLDESRGVTRQVRAGFIPTLLRWHSDGSLLLCANDRAQLQFFDLALSCVRAQMLSEDVTPANLMDLGVYFSSQPALLDIIWCYKESVPYYGSEYAPSDNYAILIFEGGPLASMSLVGGGGLAGDIQNCGLTPDCLVRMYLSWQQVEKAIGLLLSLDWNKEGALCLASLYHITNAILRAPLTSERELQLETALGSFHAPIRPLDNSVHDEFFDQVHDVTRRFFHQLVRHNLYEKAFCLAIDLNDSDLFLDLMECARRIGDVEMATAVRQQLQALDDNSGDSSCSCDASSCDEGHCLPPLPNVKKPPLPEISRFGRLRESAFFGRSQPMFSMIPEEAPDPPPLSCDLPVDSSLPSVIEKLYDLPARPKLLDRGHKNLTSSRPFVPEAGKITSSSGLSGNLTLSRPFVPETGKITNSSGLSMGTLSSTLPYIPSSNLHFSSILGPASSVPAPSSSLLPTSTSFSSSGSSQPTLPIYPANPLSSHLYGVATKAAEQKHSVGAQPVKPKVKFSDTVSQIVVPDISELNGEKPRRVKGIDPAQELADSLPLCLGNQDYLKNFAKPDDDDEMHGTTIKVIHFGVV